MDKENNAKLEKLKKALLAVTNDEEEKKEERTLNENKRQILRGNFRKDLQAG